MLVRIPNLQAISGDFIRIQKLPRILGPASHVLELYVALDSLLLLQV